MAPNVPGFDLPHIDYVLLAKGYGCEAERVTDPMKLEGALRRGLESPVAFVLEVAVEETVPPLLGKVGPKAQYQGVDEEPLQSH